MKFEYQGQPVQLEPEVKKYLKSIGKKLRLPKKIKQSVLSDLLTGMLARADDGENMKTIMDDMGTPLQVAEGINEEMDDLVYVKSPWRWACLVLILLSALVLLFQGYLGVLVLLANGMTNTIGIVGGADGPTQIFVTTTAAGSAQGLVMAVILLIMGILGFVKLSHCHKKQE